MAISDNLISYWKMDTNGSFPDAHGSNDGTIHGATYTSSGVINGAYSFDGNDYVAIGSSPSLTGDYSILIWFKTSSSATANMTGRYDSGATDGVAVRIYTGKVQVFHLIQSPFVYNNCVSASTVSDGDWHMAIATFEDGVGSKLYVDNATVVSDSTQTGAVTPVKNFWIGAQDRIVQPLYFTGTIDEVGVWSRALTGSEVSSLYNSGSGLAYPFTTSTQPPETNGVLPANIGKICGVSAASIAKINGVEVS